MGRHTTTTGRIKVGVALDPQVYEQLKQLAPGPHGLGLVLDRLIRAEASRQENAAAGRVLDPGASRAGTTPDDASLRLQQQLQSLSRRLVEVQEEERRALSRDLHDTSAQGITALKLGLGLLKRAEGCPDAVLASLDELVHVADTVSEDLHRLAVSLRPASLDRYGLLAALEQLLAEFRKQTGCAIAVDISGMQGASERLPGEVETALYRILQESLANIARHAQAKCVSISLRQTAHAVHMIVEDDGLGFDVAEALRRGRLGLLGMRERAEMLGGHLEIESALAQGACILATVPARLVDTPGAASRQPDFPPALQSPSAAGNAGVWVSELISDGGVLAEIRMACKLTCSASN